MILVIYLKNAGYERTLGKIVKKKPNHDQRITTENFNLIS